MVYKKEIYVDFSSALAHLREQGTTLSRTALSALSGADKQELAAFAQTWIDLPVERRRRTAQMLDALAEDNFELDFNALFRHLLDDEDAQVRAHAIDGLWEDEDSRLINPLVGFLRSDPDARVRAAAAESLGRFVLRAEYNRLQAPQADLVHDALLATIRSLTEPIEARCRALESLAYWGAEVVRDVIATAYVDDDALTRASAVAAMGRSADSYWNKSAVSELHSPDPRMRFQAARAVGELEIRSAVPRLSELLQDPDREVQMAAITALGQIGGDQAQDALRYMLESEDEALSSLVTDALDELQFSSNSDLLLFETDMDDDSDRGNGARTSNRQGAG